MSGKCCEKIEGGCAACHKTRERSPEEYKRLLVEVIDKPDLPIVFNVNIGHAMPRCIIPFGVDATVDVEKQSIRFEN